MKHSFTIDSRREQRSQWKWLLETVNLLVGRLFVGIVTLLLLIGLSLAFVGSGNIAHAAATKTLTQQTAFTPSSMHQGGHERGRHERGREHGRHERGEHGRHERGEHGRHERGEHGRHEHGRHEHGR